jgi:hypothetical protein
MFGFGGHFPRRKNRNIQRPSRISTLAVHRLPPLNLTPDSHFQELGLGWISLDFANPGLLPAQEPWAIR